MNWKSMCRRGSAATIRQRPRANGLRPVSSMTARGPWTATRRRNCIRMSCSSISRKHENGETRALQPHELYRSQQYATAIYRSELALRLKEHGYEIETGKSGQPEITGYTREYLEASSPRRQQIQEHLAEQGVRGAGAAQIAAHQTRDDKLPAITHEEMQQRHREMAAQFGQQPEHVMREAQSPPGGRTKPGAEAADHRIGADLRAGEKSGAPRGDR